MMAISWVRVHLLVNDEDGWYAAALPVADIGHAVRLEAEHYFFLLSSGSYFVSVWELHVVYEVIAWVLMTRLVTCCNDRCIGPDSAENCRVTQVQFLNKVCPLLCIDKCLVDMPVIMLDKFQQFSVREGSKLCRKP